VGGDTDSKQVSKSINTVTGAGKEVKPGHVFQHVGKWRGVTDLGLQNSRVCRLHCLHGSAILTEVLPCATFLPWTGKLGLEMLWTRSLFAN
jgi:hypothetical protein